MPAQRFPFRFASTFRLAGLPFGIVPDRAWVEVDDLELRASFGFWHLSTPRANVVGTQVTGPYSMLRAAGPARLSLADHGVTFATNPERGLCIQFRDPVAVLVPGGRVLRHPGLTVTVDDVDGLAAALA